MFDSCPFQLSIDFEKALFKNSLLISHGITTGKSHYILDKTSSNKCLLSQVEIVTVVLLPQPTDKHLQI